MKAEGVGREFVETKGIKHLQKLSIARPERQQKCLSQWCFLLTCTVLIERACVIVAHCGTCINATYCLWNCFALHPFCQRVAISRPSVECNLDSIVVSHLVA